MTSTTGTISVTALAVLRGAAEAAAPLWAEWTRAHTALAEVFTALDSTPDAEWKAAVSRLLNAQYAADDAARAWDAAAENIARARLNGLFGDRRAEALALAGVDPAWEIAGCHTEYGRFGGPVCHRLRHDGAGQRAHIHRISALCDADG
ncbi:hypothetical protein ABT354_36060 [Streptomyces sp. NPDC000594]|uniref:hypothetical protein n=1 Tax=Streptomyces sp. NPDC000594 TaxID=3154261 RepID=UPI0033190E13